MAKVKMVKTNRMTAVNDKMLSLFDSGKQYDCTIAVGSGLNTSSFKCHRVPLAAASPALERLLFCHFEKSGKGIDDPISLPDVTPAAFVAAMRFVYGVETSSMEKSIGLALNVLEFAAKWEIRHLDQAAVEICLELIADFSADQLLVFHNLLFLYSFTEEANKTMDIICERGSEVLDHLHIASRDTVRVIFKQEQINIGSEKDFLDGLEKWGSAQEAANVDGVVIVSSAVAGREHISEFLQLIRFKAFTEQDFGSLCAPGMSPCLSNQEKLNIVAQANLQRVPCLDSLGDLDMHSNWRGMFQPETEIVTLPAGCCSHNSHKPTWVKPSSDVYLLSVGLGKMREMSKGSQVHVLIKVLDGEKCTSTVDFRYLCPRDMSAVEQKNKMIRLKNPLLLKGGVKYTLKVRDLRFWSFSFLPQAPGCCLADYFVFGQKVCCGGQGDICALELACPIGGESGDCSNIN